MDALRLSLAQRFGVNPADLAAMAAELQPLLDQNQNSGVTASSAANSSNAGNAPDEIPAEAAANLSTPDRNNQDYQNLSQQDFVRPDSPGQDGPQNSQNAFRQNRPDGNFAASNQQQQSTSELANVLQLLLQRNSTSTSTKQDLSLVSSKNQLSHIIQQECPSTFAGRRTWLKNIQIILTNNPSGILWKENDSLLPCLPSPQSTQVINRVFTFERIVPLHFIFDYVDGNSYIQQEDFAGNLSFLQVPLRVLETISKTVFTLLIAKIPIVEGAHFHQNVQTFDGVALIKALRSTTEDLSKSLVDVLEAQADAITFGTLGDWLTVRGQLLQLKSDYDTSVRDGTISAADTLTDRKFKKLLIKVAEKLLPGIYTWCHADITAGKSWMEAILHCDVLVAAAARQVTLQAPAEANTAMQHQTPDSWDEADIPEHDVHAQYQYHRGHIRAKSHYSRLPYPQYLSRQHHPYLPPRTGDFRRAGRGAGVHRGNYWGKGGHGGKGSPAYARGRGKGAHSGAGKGGYKPQGKGKGAPGKSYKPQPKLMSYEQWCEQAFNNYWSPHSYSNVTPTTDTPTEHVDTPPAAHAHHTDSAHNDHHQHMSASYTHEEYFDDDDVDGDYDEMGRFVQ